MSLTEIQSTVYVVSHDGKIHLDPNCRYLRNRDDYTEKPASAFPNGEERLCNWCENYAEKWLEGRQKSSECARCGKPGIEKQYCERCHIKLILNR
jgi:hypothetical protein